SERDFQKESLVDRKFILSAFGYAIIGIALGIYMAGSHNHGQLVTHAHIMLVGFVVSFIYGLCHKLWLNNTTSRMAVAQFYIHQVGSLALFIGLFLLYGRFVEIATIDPVLGIASVTVLVGVVLMNVLFIKSARNA
ncbi:MAG: hypothetical protein ACRD3R_01470, partial [Terriglobales bacterium]